MPTSDHRIVGLFFKDRRGRGHICSGLYISATDVLTAKHCTCEASTFLVTNDLDLQAASTRWVNGVSRRQMGIACNSDADMDVAEGNDLALVHLDEPLPTETGAPTCSDYSLFGDIRFEATLAKLNPSAFAVTGYGRDPDAAGPQEIRRTAALQVGSLTCSDRTSLNLGCVAYREFILGPNRAHPAQFDSCGGDSGGPAMFHSEGIDIPVGLVSRALPVDQPSGGCGLGGTYTHLGRVDVLAWLKANLPMRTTLCGSALR